MTIPGGRKFIVTLVCQAATTLLCGFGKIESGVYSVVIIATVGAFITGNVIQKSIVKEVP